VFDCTFCEKYIDNTIGCLPTKPSSYFSLGFPRWLFLSGFATKNLTAFLFYPIRATCPAHLIHLDLVTRIMFDSGCKSWSSSLCSFRQCPFSSSLLDPNTSSALHPIFEFIQHAFFTIKNQFSHPYKMGKILFEHLYTISSLSIQKEGNGFFCRIAAGVP
jgi:hypothetical protein